MKFLTVILALIIFGLLTVITQIGGIVFLISIMTFGLIEKTLRNRWLRFTAKVASFVILYLIFVFVVVPLIAKPFGRVPLPLIASHNVGPTNILTVLLNRNYVRQELRQATYDVAKQLNNKYPGTILRYLDANFPFIDEFPLIPHLSHDDGKKLDVSFFYIDAETGKPTGENPSWLGYGVCEEPLPGEPDRPADCTRKGYWQYSLMSRTLPQDKKNTYPFDPTRTRDLLNFYASNNAIGKLLIEPHLKTRMRLSSNKFRLHGCNAVRHDDHVHVQLK